MGKDDQELCSRRERATTGAGAAVSLLLLALRQPPPDAKKARQVGYSLQSRYRKGGHGRQGGVPAG